MINAFYDFGRSHLLYICKCSERHTVTNKNYFVVVCIFISNSSHSFSDFT